MMLVRLCNSSLGSNNEEIFQFKQNFQLNGSTIKYSPFKWPSIARVKINPCYSCILGIELGNYAKYPYVINDGLISYL